MQKLVLKLVTLALTALATATTGAPANANADTARAIAVATAAAPNAGTGNTASANSPDFRKNGYPCITELCIGDGLDQLSKITWNRATAALAPSIGGKPTYTKELKERYADFDNHFAEREHAKANFAIERGYQGYGYNLAQIRPFKERQNLENHPACGGKNKVSIG